MRVKKIARLLDASPPSDKSAERGCIAALLLCDGGDSSRYSDIVRKNLRAQDYWHWPHAMLHRALCAGHRRNAIRSQPLWFVGLLKHENCWTKLERPCLVLAEIIDDAPMVWEVAASVKRVMAAARAREHYWRAWQELTKAAALSRDFEIWPEGELTERE